MGSKGHCTHVFAGVLLFICGICAIIAVATNWWTSNGDGNIEFSLWDMKFEYGADNKITAKHNDMCKNASGALATYCSKINAARACTIMTAFFGIVQAFFLFCCYCSPKMWVMVTCLIMGWITNGNAISAMFLGIQLANDNSLISSPAAGFICICIAMAFALVGYVLNIVGACLGPKGGGGGGCGGCKCCDCGEGGSTSAYGGHQRFRDRPPVSGGGGWRQPMGMMRPPMRAPVPAVQPQMIPYQVPVPVPVAAQQPPPQQINLNIRAVGPPGSGGMQAPPSNPPVPVVYSQHPPTSGNDDFGLDRRV